MAEWYVDYSGGDDTTGTGAIGSPYKTVAKALTVWAPADRINLKNNAQHVITTAIQPTGAMGGSTGLLASVIQGYTSAAGDGGVAEISCATTTVNIINFLAGTVSTFFKFCDLKLTHTGATRGKGITGATGAGTLGPFLCLDNVEIAGCLNAIDFASRLGTWGCWRKLYIHDSTSSGIIAYNGPQASSYGSFLDCRIDNNAGSGLIYTTNTNPSRTNVFKNCQITRNAGDGIKADVSNRTFIDFTFDHCTFADNTSDGLDLGLSGSGSIVVLITDCAFWGNGGYNLVGGTRAVEPAIVDCAWGGAGLGNVSGVGWTTGRDPQTLSASPFVGSGNYTPSGTTDGLKLRGTGVQGGYVGAICPAFGGGGSTVYLFDGGTNGGMQ